MSTLMEIEKECNNSTDNSSSYIKLNTKQNTNYNLQLQPLFTTVLT